MWIRWPSEVFSKWWCKNKFQNEAKFAWTTYFDLNLYIYYTYLFKYGFTLLLIEQNTLSSYPQPAASIRKPERVDDILNAGRLHKIFTKDSTVRLGPLPIVWEIYILTRGDIEANAGDSFFCLCGEGHSLRAFTWSHRSGDEELSIGWVGSTSWQDQVGGLWL
jgi:hypothetical protein